MAGNNALNDNPVAGQRHITRATSDWLWAVFAIMLLSFLSILLFTHTRKNRTRPFHQIPLIVLWVSTIAYFAMASDLGYTVIQAEFFGQPTRQVWWVRYIQWFINAPLILFALMSLMGVFVSDMLTTMFFAWALVVSGLVGALTRSSYKWGFYAFGLFSLIYLLYRLFAHARRHGFRDDAGAGTGAGTNAASGTGGGGVGGGRGFSGRFHLLAGWITLIWLFYPLCWGLSEGGNAISPNSEMVFYGILDIMSGPVFFLMYMAMFRGLDYPAYGNAGLGGGTGAGAAGVGAGTGSVAGAGTGAGSAAGTGAQADSTVGGYGANRAGGAPAANFGEKAATANGHTNAANHV